MIEALEPETKPRTWLREALLYTALYGTPLLLLFPYTRWRPDALFQAEARSSAIEFTVGDYKGKGPFVGGCADVSFDGASKVRLPNSDLPAGEARFRHVTLQALLVQKAKVKLLWYGSSPRGVEMRLSYASDPGAPIAAVSLDERSTAGKAKISAAEAGTADVYLPADLRAVISISPCEATTLPPVENVPLEPLSTIRFVDDKDASAILEGTNNVEVKNADRKETLFRGQRLDIGDLRDRSPRDASTISLEIKNGIAIRILGRAGSLKIDDTDARPSLAEWLRAQKILSTWLATGILVGSALLTILSRIKLVKLDQK